jgi:hypothetical protein
VKKDYEVSAPALHAANTVLRHFDLLVKPEGKIGPTVNNLAILIDVCTNSFRLQDSVALVLRTANWADKQSIIKNMDAMREALRALEVISNHCPRYEATIKVPVWQKQAVEHEVSRDLQREMSNISRALGTARTAEEEQAVLRKAGFLR